MDGLLLARRSRLTHQSVFAYSYQIQHFSPYNERMSDLYWRFDECGFAVYPRKHLLWCKQWAEIFIGDYVRRNRQKFDEDLELIDDSTCPVLLLILSLGVLSSLVALFVEIRFSTNSNLILNNLFFCKHFGIFK